MDSYRKIDWHKREVKKELFVSIGREEFERLCSMKKIGLTDYSDSLIGSWDFQTTAQETWRKIFKPSPMEAGSCRTSKNRSLARGQLKTGKIKQGERLSPYDARANRQ